MLRKTFLHIPGIGPTTERRLWSAGVTDWDQAIGPLPPDLPRRTRKNLGPAIRESLEALDQRDGVFFAQRLASKHVWRLYPEFKQDVAFFDIETTGLSYHVDHVTMIAVYDGTEIHTFVRGRNLDEFPRRIRDYKLLVTYNGRCFDVPFVEHEFEGLRLDQSHIDLRYVLASLGYSGGLKGCEEQMGLARPEGLKEVDGFMAVKLWRAHKRGDDRALPALLRYNIEDVINLRWLMETAYNLSVDKLPIEAENLLVHPLPEIDLPFDPSIIDELSSPMRAMG